MNSIREKINLKAPINQDKNSEVEQLILPLSNLGGKRIELNFQGGALSSDGGILMLREMERQLGILNRMTGCIVDGRDSRYVKQSVLDMLSQRCYQVVAGWEDGDDCDSLRDDPIYKMSVGRRPLEDEPLASQPTISRFENSLSRKELYRIGESFIDNFISSYSKSPSVVVLDFDDTVDVVHGGQQLSLFNGFYKERCYLPLHVYEGLSGKLITTILKPGKRSSGREILSVLKRIVKKLRAQWPHTIIVFRGDSHCNSPLLHDWITSQENVYFITGLTGYAVLVEHCKMVRQRVKQLYQSKQKAVKLFYSFYYRASSWKKAQRVVAVIERNEGGENIRFVVTNMYAAKSRALYQQIYCSRGNMENMIKEHKLYLKSDRTSCHRFEANQLRLFIHSAAYVLLHGLRTHLLQYTQFAKASFETIRLKILKIGAQVYELKTRIKVQLPASYPHKDVLERCCGIFAVLGKT